MVADVVLDSMLLERLERVKLAGAGLLPGTAGVAELEAVLLVGLEMKMLDTGEEDRLNAG